MKKLIRKWGKSLIISFDEEDQKIYPQIKEGNVMDLSDVVLEEIELKETAEQQLSDICYNKRRMKENE